MIFSKIYQYQPQNLSFIFKVRAINMNTMKNIGVHNLHKYCVRSFSVNMTSGNNAFFFENVLSHRSVLRVSGFNVSVFLQGLITNDLYHLETTNADSSM